MLDGVEALKLKNVCHRDIKTQNILYILSRIDISSVLSVKVKSPSIAMILSSKKASSSSLMKVNIASEG